MTNDDTSENKHSPQTAESLAAVADVIRELLREGRRAEVSRYFRIIEQETHRELLWLAKRDVPDEADARDVVAQVYMGLYRHLREDKPIGNVRAFLRILTKRRVADFWRKRTGRASSVLPDGEREGNPSGREVTMDAAFWEMQGDGDPTATTDVSVEAAEFRLFASQVAPRILRALRPELREVLIKRHCEGLDTEQTASALGLTPDQVKKRLKAAMEAAKETLRAEMRIQ